MATMDAHTGHSAARLAIPVAQVVGISAAGFLTGFGYAFSFVSIPVIFQTCPPELLAKQWRATFDLGKVMAPPIAAVSAVCFGYLASQSTHREGLFPKWSFDPTAPWALYTAAAVAMPSIVPYTLMVMKSTTLEPLLMEAAKPGSFSVEEVKQLLVLWTKQNNVRQVFGAVGTVLGLVATIFRTGR